jgi:hypothetical protein
MPQHHVCGAFKLPSLSASLATFASLMVLGTPGEFDRGADLLVRLEPSCIASDCEACHSQQHKLHSTVMLPLN